MNRLPIPNALHDINPSWLTDALGRSMTARAFSVVSYSAETIGAGKGFMASLFRLNLTYDGEHPGLPSTLILKLPSNDPKLRALSDKLRQSEREVMFYQEIQAHDHLRIPGAYHSDMDPETGDTILLLEDVSGGLQGDSVIGCSLPQARHCITQLARFQAAWWGHPGLNRLDWMPLKDAETGAYRDLWPEAWETLRGKAGNGMPENLLSLGDRLGSRIPEIKAQLGRRPLTLIHGDYRLDNCFFPPHGDPGPPVVIDWEFCARSRGAYDVATFITETFPPAHRRTEEMGLLHAYHSTLLDAGVTGYPFEECLIDYRLSVLELFVFWVVTGACCDFSGERATTYLHNTLHRLDTAISDLSCTDLLIE